MILGYGMQDPDNWDTDACGRPVDPYQGEWDAIQASKTRARELRKRLGLGEPIVPQPCLTPKPACTPSPSDPMHNLSRSHMRCVCSGHFRCTRCGFEWEHTYLSVGLAHISNGYRVLSMGEHAASEPGPAGPTTSAGYGSGATGS